MDIGKYSSLKGCTGRLTVSRIETAPQFLTDCIQKIRNGENFTIVKFGDGEWLNMIATTEYERNCDGNNYFRPLGDELIHSYIYFLQHPTSFIARWPCEYNIEKQLVTDFPCELDKFIFYDIIIHKYPFTPGQVEFFKEIKNSLRQKIYISNEQMVHTLLPFLNIDIGIVTPPINSYVYKDQIINRVLGVAKENCIIMFSCGMASKVFIMHLSRQLQNATFIDVGSSFDGLIRVSRDYNAGGDYKEHLINAYKN